MLTSVIALVGQHHTATMKGRESKCHNLLYYDLNRKNVKFMGNLSCGFNKDRLFFEEKWEKLLSLVHSPKKVMFH